MTQWKSLGLVYAGDGLNLQRKKEMGREEEKGKEEKRLERKKGEVYYYSLHLCAKIANKHNLRKNKFILFIVLGHMHYGRGHMVVGTIRGAESAGCSCSTHPLTFAQFFLTGTPGPGMVLLHLGWVLI